MTILTDLLDFELQKNISVYDFLCFFDTILGLNLIDFGIDV